MSERAVGGETAAISSVPTTCATWPRETAGIAWMGADAFLASAPIQAMPAVSRGQVAQVVGTELIAAVSPPTALSLTYGLDELVASLSAAAQAG